MKVRNGVVDLGRELEPELKTFAGARFQVSLKSNNFGRRVKPRVLYAA